MGKKPSKPPVAAPEFDRVEFHADFSWVQELDRVAKLMGMTRSAYIRHACTRQMAADRQLLSGPGGSPED